jgi:hypothetical protein
VARCVFHFHLHNSKYLSEGEERFNLDLLFRNIPQVAPCFLSQKCYHCDSCLLLSDSTKITNPSANSIIASLWIAFCDTENHVNAFNAICSVQRRREKDEVLRLPNLTHELAMSVFILGFNISVQKLYA